MKLIFTLLSKINSSLLPKYSKEDLTKLNKFQKAITAYRYWVTKNSLPKKEQAEAREDK